MIKLKNITILILVGISFLVNAQNSDISKELKEVIVSENRASLSQNITNVYIIQLKDIKNAPVQSIEELLEYALNVDVRQRSGQGIQSDISIRGGNFEQVLIMLNGIKMNDPQTGHHNMDIPVSLEQIKRIEILTGGASRVFGNYAFTGAINIITKKNNSSSIILSAGKDNFIDTELNLSKKINSIHHTVSVNSKKYDGYINNMDYKINNLFYQANTKIQSTKALFNFGIINKEFGAFNFYTPVYPDQFEKTQTTFASLQIKRKGKISIENKLYWRRHDDDFTLFRSTPEWYQNFHQTNVYALEANAIYNTQTGSNVIGMEIRTDQILSNVLGEDLENPISVNNSDGLYLKGKSETITNLFAEKNLTINKLDLSTGVMLNINSVNGNNYFPGIDISYNLSNRFKIFASYNESMRAPNYTERFYSSPTNQGNQFLKNEYSINKELGAKYNGRIHNSSITVYNRKGENMIDWILLQGDSIWRTDNLTSVNCNGYEINSSININNINSSSPITRVAFNYSYNQLDTSSIGFQSAYVLDNLKEKLSLMATQKIGKKTFINWRATMQDREGSYIDYESKEELSYPKFWLASVRISHKIGKKTLFFEMKNITNKQYIDFGNIPQAGRWIRAGLKIKF